VSYVTRDLLHTRRFYAREVRRRDQAARGSWRWRSEGRSYHVALESNGEIQVFDIWDSQQDFDAFGPTLMPILAGLGVELKAAIVATVRNVIRG